MAKDWNILVFYTDQQRYDSLGCNGNTVAHTPHLDALAAEGSRLENHIAAHPVCMPSRASFFTGRFPNAHRVWSNGVPLPTAEETLPQVLAEQGYDTASCGKIHLNPTQADAAFSSKESRALWQTGELDGWHGPYVGFDHVELTIGHGEQALQVGHYANEMRRRLPELQQLIEQGKTLRSQAVIQDSYKSTLPVEAHHSTWVADKTIAYLREARRRERPFFVFCSFPDPHHPFTPPAPYSTMFDDVPLPGPYRSQEELASKPIHYRAAMEQRLHPQEGGAIGLPAEMDPVLREVMAHTYGMVSLIDHNVGRVLNTLSQCGLAQNTIVLFTSDHGELLGDHWLLRKGPYPCRSLLRVPCIIRAPGLIPAGTVLSAPSSNTDIMPTLLALAGLRAPARMQGRSLSAALRGEVGQEPQQALSMGWSKDTFRFNHQTIFTREWRLSWFPNLDDGELYNLEHDPYELNNLFHDPGHRSVRQALLLDLHRAYSRSEEPESTPICSY